MKSALYIVTSALLLGCTPEQNRLEAERTATAAQLEKLPRLKIDTLIPTLGYLSKVAENQRTGDRITIAFPEPKPADTVVLVPVNFLNNKNEYVARGFPLRFKIEAQTPENETLLIADHTQSDFLCPGIAPVIFKIADPRPVKSLTLSVTKLSPGNVWFSKLPIFMLNELLVFSGEENMALNAAVDSESPFRSPFVFDPDYLVDGYSYFPPIDPATGKPFRQFTSFEAQLQLFFDLGKTQTLNGARFYPNNLNPQFLNPHSASIGFPKEILLKVSDSPSFENAVTRIISNAKHPTYVSNAPLCKKLKSITGRYVQITLKEGRKDPRRSGSPMISLSEIELLHNGINRLTGIPFETATPLKIGEIHKIKPTVLTDGKSILGTIVPQKKWLLQLARRAELEQENAELILKQERSYAQQKETVRNLLFAIPFLLISFLFLLLRNRYQHRKNTQALRERIADDLHDETGATLSSIANSAQLLAELSSGKNSDDEAELIADIIGSAERSAKETRALILFLEKNSSQGDLIDRFRNTARQMLSGFELTLDLQAEKQFNQLIPIQKWDLLLFFKEVLNNIIKHAAADAVEIRTRKKGHALHLEIRDNGKGLPLNTQPTHLAKRAKKLNAKIEVTSPETGGTTIKCTLSKGTLSRL
ncbi:Sensor histidine kinase LiaS [Pontiella desulfatans]|uniref:histidine kinase n=1 Tax=Pontiella desulfatans TaxID=2750659 RepID=A0A6C2U0T6_PONDE|nr:ATP-binding protein [Pontiella desulfatans]VGO13578.1 Sensor histidine kinase LiaS [Pontiella desulfatans]